ncbi:phage tail tape measure protein [Deinococcus ruber]|uniref:Phage tail tape measure protein domain-containing protein n=1 Tax=Deinococcus ruber TaxID=1848197 RepID=A0A918CC78_9DEIO|nr:phage tail tape measure protein [Deinococcus ruber]GGR16864.1 hypothetical protein GCM10008957_31880 [Deinococcus ruber]
MPEQIVSYRLIASTTGLADLQLFRQELAAIKESQAGFRADTGFSQAQRDNLRATRQDFSGLEFQILGLTDAIKVLSTNLDTLGTKGSGSGKKIKDGFTGIDPTIADVVRSVRTLLTEFQNGGIQAGEFNTKMGQAKAQLLALREENSLGTRELQAVSAALNIVAKNYGQANTASSPYLAGLKAQKAAMQDNRAAAVEMNQQVMQSRRAWQDEALSDEQVVAVMKVHAEAAQRQIALLTQQREAIVALGVPTREEAAMMQQLTLEIDRYSLASQRANATMNSAQGRITKGSLAAGVRDGTGAANAAAVPAVNELTAATERLVTQQKAGTITGETLITSLKAEETALRASYSALQAQIEAKTRNSTLTLEEAGNVVRLVATQDTYTAALARVRAALTQAGGMSAETAALKASTTETERLINAEKARLLTRQQLNAALTGQVTSQKSALLAIESEMTALKNLSSLDVQQVERLAQLTRAQSEYTAALAGTVAAQERSAAMSARAAFAGGAGLRANVGNLGMAASFISPQAGMLGMLATLPPTIAGVAALGVAIGGVVKLTKDGEGEAKALQQAYLIMTANGIQNIKGIDTSLNDMVNHGSDAEKMFSKAELATALASLARGGVKGADAMKDLRVSVQLAAAEHISLDDATKRLYGNLQHFGLEADQAAGFGDKLARASHLSMASMDELSKGLNVAGQTFKESGFSIDELLGALVSAARKGMDPATVGATGLRNALMAIQHPSDQAKADFAALGVALQDSNGHARSGHDIFTELQSILSSTGPVYNKLTGNLITHTDAVKMIFDIYKTRGATAFMSVLGDIKSVDDEIGNSKGFLQEYSSTVVGGLQGAQQRLDAAVKNLSGTFNTLFVPALTTVVKWVASGVSTLNDFVGQVAHAHSGVEQFAMLKISSDDSPVMVFLKDVHNVVEGISGALDTVQKKLEDIGNATGLRKVGDALVTAFPALGDEAQRNQLAQDQAKQEIDAATKQLVVLKAELAKLAADPKNKVVPGAQKPLIDNVLTAGKPAPVSRVQEVEQAIKAVEATLAAQQATLKKLQDASGTGGGFVADASTLPLKTGDRLADTLVDYCAKWVRLSLDHANPQMKAAIDNLFQSNPFKGQDPSADSAKRNFQSANLLHPYTGINDLKPGDTVFFDHNHVGVYLGNGMVRGNNEVTYKANGGTYTNGKADNNANPVGDVYIGNLDHGHVAGFVRLSEVADKYGVALGRDGHAAPAPAPTPAASTTPPREHDPSWKAPPATIQTQFKDLQQQYAEGTLKVEAYHKALEALIAQAKKLEATQQYGSKAWHATADLIIAAEGALKRHTASTSKYGQVYDQLQAQLSVAKSIRADGGTADTYLTALGSVHSGAEAAAATELAANGRSAKYKRLLDLATSTQKQINAINKQAASTDQSQALEQANFQKTLDRDLASNKISSAQATLAAMQKARDAQLALDKGSAAAELTTEQSRGQGILQAQRAVLAKQRDQAIQGARDAAEASRLQAIKTYGGEKAIPANRLKEIHDIAQSAIDTAWSTFNSGSQAAQSELDQRLAQAGDRLKTQNADRAVQSANFQKTVTRQLAEGQISAAQATVKSMEATRDADLKSAKDNAAQRVLIEQGQGKAIVQAHQAVLNQQKLLTIQGAKDTAATTLAEQEKIYGKGKVPKDVLDSIKAVQTTIIQGARDTYAGELAAVKAGQQERLTAALEAQSTRNDLLQKNQLAADQALAENQTTLSKTQAQAVLDGYTVALQGAGQNAAAILKVERDSSASRLAAMNALSAAEVQAQITALEQKRNKEMNAEGVTAAKRRALWASYGQQIAALDDGLIIKQQANAQTVRDAVRKAADAATKGLSEVKRGYQDAADTFSQKLMSGAEISDKDVTDYLRSLSDLWEQAGKAGVKGNAQIQELAALAKQLADPTLIYGIQQAALAYNDFWTKQDVRYGKGDVAADSALRQSYGSGQNGLEAAMLGSGANVKLLGDPQAALADLDQFNKAAADRIRRVYADELKEFQTYHDGLNASILETTTAAYARIKQSMQDEQDVADDASTTVECLTDMLGRVVANGLDPRTSGYVQLLDEIIAKGGQAGDAAQQVKNNLDALIDVTQDLQQAPSMLKVLGAADAFTPGATGDFYNDGALGAPDSGPDPSVTQALQGQLDSQRAAGLKELTDAALKARAAEDQLSGDGKDLANVLSEIDSRAQGAKTALEALPATKLQLQLNGLERQHGVGNIGDLGYANQKEQLQRDLENAQYAVSSAHLAGAALEAAQLQHEDRLTQIHADGEAARKAVTDKATADRQAVYLADNKTQLDTLEFNHQQRTIGDATYYAQKAELERKAAYLTYYSSKMEAADWRAFQTELTRITREGITDRQALTDKATADRQAGYVADNQAELATLEFNHGQKKVLDSDYYDQRDALQRKAAYLTYYNSKMELSDWRAFQAELTRIERQGVTDRQALGSHTSNKKTDPLDDSKKSIDALKESYRQGTTAAQDFWDQAQKLIDGLDLQAAAAEKVGNTRLAEGYRQQEAALRELMGPLGQALEEIHKYKVWVEEAGGALGSLFRALGDGERDYDQFGKKLNTPWKDLAANIDGAVKAYATFDSVATDVAKLIASGGSDIGSWVHLAATVISSIADALSGFQKAKAQVAQMQEDFRSQFTFVNGEDFAKTYTRSRGFFADLFGGGPEVVQEIDKVGVVFAKTMDSAFGTGIKDGLKNALMKNDFSEFSKSLKESVFGGVVDGITDAFKSEVLNSVIGPAIKAWAAAMKTPGTEDDAAAMQGLKDAVGTAEQLGQQYYSQVQPLINGLKDSWGLDDNGQTASSSSSGGTTFGSVPSAVQVAMPTQWMDGCSLLDIASKRIDGASVRDEASSIRTDAAITRFEQALAAATRSGSGSSTLPLR